MVKVLNVKINSFVKHKLKVRKIIKFFQKKNLWVSHKRKASRRTSLQIRISGCKALFVSRTSILELQVFFIYRMEIMKACRHRLPHNLSVHSLGCVRFVFFPELSCLVFHCMFFNFIIYWKVYCTQTLRAKWRLKRRLLSGFRACFMCSLENIF